MQRHKQWYVLRSKQCLDTQLDSESGELCLYGCMRWFHCGDEERGRWYSLPYGVVQMDQSARGSKMPAINTIDYR